MFDKPDQILSQVKFAPSGIDEQAEILLVNPAGKMAAATPILHAKQPKRGMISFNKGYIEIYEYPRAEKAVITYTADGSQKTVAYGKTVFLIFTFPLGYAIINSKQKCG